MTAKKVEFAPSVEGEMCDEIGLTEEELQDLIAKIIEIVQNDTLDKHSRPLTQKEKDDIERRIAGRKTKH